VNVNKIDIEQAKRLGLLSYLKSYEPHNLVRKGHEYCTKEHDSLVISENGLWHWFSRGIGGKTALQYLIKVKNMDFVNAVNHINNLQPNMGIDLNYIEKRKIVFTLPKAHTDNSRVFIYLKCRGISKDVISYCVRNNLIYESADYHNAVFVGYDGDTPRYAALRGTYQQANCSLFAFWQICEKELRINAKLMQVFVIHSAYLCDKCIYPDECSKR